jgi:hypothetical protein
MPEVTIAEHRQSRGGEDKIRPPWQRTFVRVVLQGVDAKSPAEEKLGLRVARLVPSHSSGTGFRRCAEAFEARTPEAPWSAWLLFDRGHG